MFYLYSCKDDDLFGRFLHKDHYFYSANVSINHERMTFDTYNDVKKYIIETNLPSGIYQVINAKLFTVGTIVHNNMQIVVNELLEI